MTFDYKKTHSYLVFSDDDTWESLTWLADEDDEAHQYGGSTAVLIEGEFDPGARDGSVGDLLSAHDDGIRALPAEKRRPLHPVVMLPDPIGQIFQGEVSDDGVVKIHPPPDPTPITVRCIQVGFLLEFYLEHRGLKPPPKGSIETALVAHAKEACRLAYQNDGAEGLVKLLRGLSEGCRGVAAELDTGLEAQIIADELAK